MSLQFFPATSPNKTGVLIVPGGGYSFISDEHEGSTPAKWLNHRGYDAWVLSYTCADGNTTTPIYPIPQREALDAVKKIRAQDRISKLGIWGWSAGGHLAAVTATTREAGAQLDFVVLSYPVISMDHSITHPGSRTNLLGDNPPRDLVRRMSAQNRVSAATPPAFIFHTSNDDAVPVQNSLVFATAMAEHKRPFKLFILPDGPHGIGLALDNPELTWTAELDRWLKGIVAA